VILLALSTGHKVGLGVMAALFIAFALTSAFLLPRYRPDFPGRQGLRVFVLLSLVLFVAMMAAVTIFGKEASESEAASAAPGAKGGAKTVDVTAKDFKFQLPNSSVSPGSYTFVLKNEGPSGHDLVVKGPGVKNTSTPVIGPGKTASLEVTLKSGSYELYCSVPGHKQLGMDLTLKVA
jgi:uncharacterized cupredoxin-like copper-binding protein